ncbi:Uncharacterized protein TCM_024839 [Theobroma cacao]|uniref:Reverse transcriptase Ty1/copia-type domain-containing protein n=1 Tax=Theobroma cacao TaxID=3641 RepID=A0A061EX85_THECC|nr:Uncharacterized protein TCM_024839 [Theobroma cacao]
MTTLTLQPQHLNHLLFLNIFFLADLNDNTTSLPTYKTISALLPCRRHLLCHYAIAMSSPSSSLMPRATICVLLTVVVVACHWPLHQLDIQNAFLHGNLNEEVYMQLPLGY